MTTTNNINSSDDLTHLSFPASLRERLLLKDDNSSTTNSTGAATVAVTTVVSTNSNSVTNLNQRHLTSGNCSEDSDLVDNTPNQHQQQLIVEGVHTAALSTSESPKASSYIQNHNQNKTQSQQTSDFILSVLILLALSFVSFFSNFLCSLIAPILPNKNIELNIDVVWVGVVFSVFPTAILLFSPLMNTLSSKYLGRNNVLILGCIIQGLSALVFGYTEDIVMMVMGEEAYYGSGYSESESVKSQMSQQSSYSDKFLKSTESGPGSEPSNSMSQIQSSTSSSESDSHSYRNFLLLSLFLLSRTLQGAGASACNLAVFSMVAERFENSLGKVMSLNEILIGAGFSLGPPGGAWLESKGGFSSPFLFGGCCVLMTVVVGIGIKGMESSSRNQKLQSESDSNSKSNSTKVVTVSQWDSDKHTISEVHEQQNNNNSNVSSTTSKLLSLLKSSPSMIASSLLLFLGTTIFGLVEPIYTLHCESYLNITKIDSGYMLAWLSVVYSCAGFPAGAWGDRSGEYLKVLKYGCLFSSFSLLLLGFRSYIIVLDSSSQYDYSFKLSSELVILTILGIGQAGLLVPSLPAMKASIKTTKSSNKSNPVTVTKDQTESVVTLFNIFQNGGLIFGPLLGAWLNKWIGFEVTCIVGSVMGFGCYLGVWWSGE